MAIKPPSKPPGSITQPADQKKTRIPEVSNVNRVVSEMQQKVNQKIDENQADIGKLEGIEEVQNSMVDVLKSLNSTVGTLGYGFAKIANETSKASADAIKQYGKAISEDIGVNKQNIVASALAQSSPIFGYFAAKFVETDVFQSAKEKMKSNISEALGGVTSRFKEGFGSLLSQAKTKGEKEKPIKRIAPKAGKIPKMQHGGYVEKAGIAKLHAAEVVVPIDKILQKIDESISITHDLAEVSKHAQLKTLAKMETYVSTTKKFQKVGIIKGFTRAMKEVHSQYTEPDNTRMLRALLGIQDALGAQVGSWQQVWQKMLVEHPTFRSLVLSSKVIGNILGAPFKFIYGIFKSRGGYQSHLSKAKNPLEAMVENLGLIYSEGMWRLDNIALFTKASAEATRDLSTALLGKKYPPLKGVSTGVWSIFTLTKRFVKLFSGQKMITQKKALESMYGAKSASDIGSIFTKKIKQETASLQALPVADINLAQFSDKFIGYIDENKKNQKKLLGYTVDIANSSEESADSAKAMNRRGKRKGIFGLFGGILGGIKNLLGTGLGFVLPLLTNKLFPWGTKLLKSISTKVIPFGLKLAQGILASPIFWAGISSAILGTGIGLLIRKLLGMDKSQKEKYKNMNKIEESLDKKNRKIVAERFKASKLGGKKGFKSTEALKTTSQIGMSKGFADSIGAWAEHSIGTVIAAQQNYMNENLDKYLEYGSDQVGRLRSKWIKDKKFPAMHMDYPPQWYGKEREAAFLKYLQKEGKPLTELQKEQAFKSYAAARPQGLLNRAKEIYGEQKELLIPFYSKLTKKQREILLPFYKTLSKDQQALLFPFYKELGGKISERAQAYYKDKKELIQEGVTRGMAGARALEKTIAEQGKKVGVGFEQAGKGVAAAVTQVSNSVTSSIQNNSRIINNTASKLKDIFSEYEQAVIKGDYMMEGF